MYSSQEIYFSFKEQSAGIRQTLFDICKGKAGKVPRVKAPFTATACWNSLLRSFHRPLLRSFEALQNLDLRRIESNGFTTIFGLEQLLYLPASVVMKSWKTILRQLRKMQHTIQRQRRITSFLAMLMPPTDKLLKKLKHANFTRF